MINVMTSLLEVSGGTVELPTVAGWVRPVNEVSLGIDADESLGPGRGIRQREDHVVAGRDGITAARGTCERRSNVDGLIVREKLDHAYRTPMARRSRQ